MDNKDKTSADNLFSNLNYYKIFYEDGFFWHNHETDKCVSFNLKKKNGKYMIMILEKVGNMEMNF